MLTSTIAMLADDYHHWNDGGSGWWFWGPLMMAIWIALIVGLIVLLTRRVEPHPHPPGDRAKEILAERYASGDLTTDEYHERLRALDH